MLKERVQELCKQKGITIKFLEEELGLGKSSILKWDKVSPKAENLIKVADYFGVSIDYLLDRSPLEEKQKAIDEATALYEQLSPEDKEKVKSFIQFMASQK